MMQVIADLHIHGKYSRGCSTDLDIGNLEKYARLKGVNLLGTGDFTHPLWFNEIKEKLSEDGTGILKTKTGFPFILQTEISLIYSQGGKGRRIHNIVLAPSLEVASQITDRLMKKGRVDYDGRPIFHMSCPEFVEIMKEIDKSIEIIPAHIWTPWFSLFGSNSGFDSVKECFLDKTKEIHALETGLSSDPPMNWRLSQLDDFSLVSFSDLHSYWPWRIGREATIFDINLSYSEISKALKTKEGLIGTIEVDPNYGKYHVDGHRTCGVVLNPKESMKINNICPACKKPITIGVLHRVEELSDRPEGYAPPAAKKFYSLIPLSEILASILGKGIATKIIWDAYYRLVSGSTEIEVLLDMPHNEIASKTNKMVADAIVNVRESKISFKPGYDGVYGEPIFEFKGKPEEKTDLVVKNNHVSNQRLINRTGQRDLADFF